MDTYSASRAARVLGTSAPRILRAVRRLGLEVRRSRAGALAIDQTQLERLADELGGSPVPSGLSRTQARVLAALARSPRGLASLRAVARRAGVSPTAASHALSALEAEGLVRTEHTTVAMGSVVDADVHTAVVAAPKWSELAPQLALIKLPSPEPSRPADVVPRRLRHLFWNTAPSQLRVAGSASYIAKRLLSTGDADGLAWGATHLPPEAWESAARARGLDPRDRALALNLARSARGAA
jgi:DNA-binding Lrp family transcriptional regulator